MAMRNFTGEDNQKAHENFFCSIELTRGIQSQLVSLSVVNVLLSITAFLGNTLILTALYKETSIHPPSKLLFCSLAATDLCVGLTAEPVAVIYWISAVNEQWIICRFTRDTRFVAGYILCSVSLFTMTAISVDRLLALLLGLRYRQIVTLKRTYVIVVGFWVVSVVGSILSLKNNLILLIYYCVIVLVCLVTSLCCNIKIFITLRHRQHQVHNGVQRQPIHATPLIIARYRKAVYTALWVQLTLLICYLPYNILEASTNRSTLTPSIHLAKQVTSTLIYLNSSINPILYCWKIREVRQEMKETIRTVFCSSS